MQAPPGAMPLRRDPPLRKQPRRKSLRSAASAPPTGARAKSSRPRRKVFAERGYHGATTQDIADVLKIRQASLYYYFPSKEVALELVCMRGVEGFYETEKAIAEGPGTATERLSGLIRAHISPLLDRGNFMKVFLTQRQFLPAHSRRKIRKVSRGIEAIFEDRTAARSAQRRVPRRSRYAACDPVDPVDREWLRGLVFARAGLDRAHRRRVHCADPARDRFTARRCRSTDTQARHAAGEANNLIDL